MNKKHEKQKEGIKGRNKIRKKTIIEKIRKRNKEKVEGKGR